MKHRDGSNGRPAISRGAPVEVRVQGSFHDLGWFEGVVVEVEPAYLGWPERFLVRIGDERQQDWFERGEVRVSRAES